MYKRNVEARLGNHCCSGRAISNSYFECASVALAIHNVTCGLSGSIIFFSTLFHKSKDFLGKTYWKKCVLNFSTSLV